MRREGRERSSKKQWDKVSKRIEASHLREVQRNSTITATTPRQRETSLVKEKGWQAIQTSLQMKSIIRKTAKKKESDLIL